MGTKKINLVFDRNTQHEYFNKTINLLKKTQYNFLYKNISTEKIDKRTFRLTFIKNDLLNKDKMIPLELTLMFNDEVTKDMPILLYPKGGDVVLSRFLSTYMLPDELYIYESILNSDGSYKYNMYENEDKNTLVSAINGMLNGANSPKKFYSIDTDKNVAKENFLKTLNKMVDLKVSNSKHFRQRALEEEQVELQLLKLKNKLYE